MTVNTELDIAGRLCPFPHSGSSGAFSDGWMLNVDRRCNDCPKRSCQAWMENADLGHGLVPHHVCEYQLVSYAAQIGTEKVLIPGVYDPSLVQISDRARKKRLAKTRLVTRKNIEEWARRACDARSALMELLQEHVQAATAPLHDLKPAVGILQRNVEAYLKTYPGATLEEKIDQTADRDLVGLLKAASLLASRLNLTSLVSNPASASYGRKRPARLYPMFHKFVRLFEPVAQGRGLRISMEGASYASAAIYDSFESIPLLLIENAIKHSIPNTTIRVTVEDRLAGIHMEVASCGDLVPVAERLSIFERGYRGKNAAVSGTGLGLYIANTVARAHGAQILYSATSSKECDWNRFQLFVTA